VAPRRAIRGRDRGPRRHESPVGVRMASSMDFFPSHERVLGRMAKVLHPDGHVGMLVLREGPFNTAIRETETFTIRHVRAIEIGGLYPHMFVLERAQ